MNIQNIFILVVMPVYMVLHVTVIVVIVYNSKLYMVLHVTVQDSLYYLAACVECTKSCRV